jgi:hypothetical protein
MNGKATAETQRLCTTVVKVTRAARSCRTAELHALTDDAVALTCG